jgi:GAF domain-containing protein
LARVFVELADTLIDDFDAVDFLQVLTDRCVELLDVDAAGLMLADQRGDLQLLASTMNRARLLELFEPQVEEGPCPECFSTGRPVVNVDLADAQGRWPHFAPAAVEAGFGGMHALPMRLRRQVIGALDLFTDRPDHLDDETVAVAQAMADVATIGLLHERNLSEQAAIAEQLQTALNSRVLIEQAKGVLASRADLNVDEAFTRMRAHARRNGVTLTGVAAAVVSGSMDIELITSA